MKGIVAYGAVAAAVAVATPVIARSQTPREWGRADPVVRAASAVTIGLTWPVLAAALVVEEIRKAGGR